MSSQDHFREAEKLLRRSQLAVDADGEVYPAREDDVDSVGHSLQAAFVHATLAVAGALQVIARQVTP